MHNPADAVHFLGILLLLRFSLFFALVLFSTFWNERELLSNYRNTTLATHIRFHKLKEKPKRSMAIVTHGHSHKRVRVTCSSPVHRDNARVTQQAIL